MPKFRFTRRNGKVVAPDVTLPPYEVPFADRDLWECGVNDTLNWRPVYDAQKVKRRKLEEDARQAIILRYVQKLTFREIGQLLPSSHPGQYRKAGETTPRGPTAVQRLIYWAIRQPWYPSFVEAIRGETNEAYSK